MAEWDRLESRLKDLGQAASAWVDEPLDPADIRRLGVQRRHRRWVVVAVVAMVIAFGGGAGVWAAGSLPQHREPVPVGTPTLTPSPTVTPTEMPSEESTAGTVGHGRRVEPSRPGETQRLPSQNYPTRSPEEDETTSTPTPTQTETETEPTETSEPSPSEPEESEPGPMAKPTDDGGDEPNEPAPEPTDESSPR
jgi:cytoskeletal protein RodZ